MELTQQQQLQKQFFEDFGYLFIPGLLKDEIDWITEEFEAVFRESGIVHDGTKRSGFGPFIERSERLCTIIDHPGMVNMLTAILGEDFNYMGSAGELYVGDGLWHPDGVFKVVKYVKVALYLDPLTRESGALRLVPGSHLRGYEGNQDTMERWGIGPHDVPCVAPDNQPGDVAAFNLNTLHNSLNGGNRRRMLNFGCSEHCETEEQLQDLKCRLPLSLDRLFSDVMLRTASPERMRHLRQSLEIVAQRPLSQQ
ncbi:MAG: phytanoyl-CoA dioxygenase family protein [Candidatus Latescibacteria bacterium]|nr:phytanoyl-CoA dioxygenase family protein [Candidatus Latescibacterota bacterium]